jgi:hypothetical protein
MVDEQITTHELVDQKFPHEICGRIILENREFRIIFPSLRCCVIMALERSTISYKLDGSIERRLRDGIDGIRRITGGHIKELFGLAFQELSRLVILCICWDVLWNTDR